MKRAFALTIAALLTAGPALAQPGFGMGPGMMGYGFGQGYGPGMMGYGVGPGYGMGWMQPGRGRFMMNDANNDGLISAEEAASAADEVFTAMDADDDGLLTQEEYMAVRMGPQLGFNPARQQAMQEAKAARFGEMDSNKDGSVSKEEFLAAAKSHYEASDTDGDGKVTPWEHRGRNWN